VATPGFDANRHRCAPGPDEFAIAADFVTDKDRLVKHHAVDGYLAHRPRARRAARLPPARSICASSHPPKMSPFGLASAGIAKTRTSGSVRGNSTSDPSS